MRKLLFYLSFMLMASCIDPLNIKSVETKYSIVVDGMITDQPGPYTVKLFQTIAITDQLDSTHQLSGATLKITDDAGGSETLTEQQPGVYNTSTTTGVIGKTYTLFITTKDGHTYQSTPETLSPVGDISNLRAEFVKSGPPDPGSVDTQDGFNILLDAQLNPAQQGRVRWRWTGTFEVATFPKFRTKVIDQNGGMATVPDPPPCSGWRYYLQTIYDESTGLLTQKWEFNQFDTCKCCFCWDTQYSSIPHISDQIPGASTTLSAVNVAFIQANKWYLYNKYYLEVEQLSCSPAVYEFWKQVKSQEDQGGDLFQTPPAATGGNISSTSSGGNPIIGVFGASAIKKQSIVLTRADVPYAVPHIDTLFTECFSLYPNSSEFRPSFY